MEITDVEALVLRADEVDAGQADGAQDTLLVRVHTDAGIVGVGEVDSSPELVAAAIMAPASNAVVQGLRSLVIGEDPGDPAALWQRMYDGSIYSGRRGAVVHAMSGIDMAVWDICGKAAGVPVCQLLGQPQHSSIRVYASVLMPEGQGDVAALVSSLTDDGFRAVKLGWGPLGHDPDRDIALAAAARTAVGPDIDLMLDVGGRYEDVTAAARLGDALADLGYRWLEEPFHADKVHLFRDLRQRTRLPIAGGEQYAPAAEFTHALDHAAFDVVQPDLSRCGGFSEALRIADLVEEHGVWCVPHAWKTGVLKAATLHWNAVLPGERLQEWSIAGNDLAARLVRAGDLPLVDGVAAIPTKPGLGIDIDGDVIERHLVA